ncbi:MAG: asparaginase domain-containing protein [Planctomycetota bacterium]
MRQVELITTGGTIEKTYDEFSGELSNKRSIVQRMLRRLRLDDAEVHVRRLMSVDSRDMTEEQREQIVRVALAAMDLADAVIILHGTDTLAVTGERMLLTEPKPSVPIVLTGAMRPFEMRSSDAQQNLTEALLASSMLDPGVYFAGHGKVLSFPGVHKNYERGTFVKEPSA